MSPHFNGESHYLADSLHMVHPLVDTRRQSAAFKYDFEDSTEKPTVTVRIRSKQEEVGQRASNPPIMIDLSIKHKYRQRRQLFPSSLLKHVKLAPELGTRSATHEEYDRQASTCDYTLNSRREAKNECYHQSAACERELNAAESPSHQR